ncbi:MAG: hypothetical protein IJY35_10495, partial [Clostridia bacterium]|nr:hypothetical protein [Clostridia bacterium]
PQCKEKQPREIHEAVCSFCEGKTHTRHRLATPARHLSASVRKGLFDYHDGFYTNTMIPHFCGFVKTFQKKITGQEFRYTRHRENSGTAESYSDASTPGKPLLFYVLSGINLCDHLYNTFLSYIPL